MFILGHFDLYGHSQPYIVGLMIPGAASGRVYPEKVGRASAPTSIASTQ